MIRLIFFIIIFLCSCVHCPSQDILWYDPYMQAFRWCPKGFFDEKNHGKTWWIEEDLEKFKKDYQKKIKNIQIHEKSDEFKN